MYFPKKVKSALLGIVDDMTCNISPFVKDPEKDFSRNRKLSFTRMLLFFLSMGSNCLNFELQQFFHFAPDAIPSESAFIQQRSKLLPEAFRHILAQFNHAFALDKYKGKYVVLAADGSEFNIARNANDPSTYHPESGRSKKGFNSVLAVALFDLFSKRYLDVVLQPGREKNEFSALCQLMDRYAYGAIPIFIADRGFASYNVFAHALENGHFFAIRAKDINVKRILGISSLAESMDVWSDVILTRSNSKKKRLHPELEPLYRYICKAVTFDFLSAERTEYPLHLRIVRFQTDGGNYANIITNLPDDAFDTEEVKFLYGLRWGIETSFMELKHTIGTENFHSKAPRYIEFEIFCRMILYNFCTIITMKVPVEKKGRKWEYKVNLSMAIKTCFSFLRGNVLAKNVNELIGNYILPFRPGRSYPRRVRFQAPASFSYRFV